MATLAYQKEGWNSKTQTITTTSTTLTGVGGTAGGGQLATNMEAAGDKIDGKQAAMTGILGKETLTAKDTATLNVLNNDISLLASAQKALNQAAGAAQRAIAA
jgi:hypothetical protein